MGRHKLFLFESQSARFRMLLLDAAISQTFTIVTFGETKGPRKGPCLANFQDSFVLIIGGEETRNVERISIVTSEAVSLAMQLNQERVSASACALGDAVYVFGGINDM